MTYSRSERCWVWLSALKGMTPRKFYALLSVAEDPENVFDSSSDFLPYLDDKLGKELMAGRSEETVDALFEKMERLSVTALIRTGDAYPSSLHYISDPPPTLFMRGSMDLNALLKPFAVVGTRMPTYDGRKAAGEFVRSLAEQGVTVISGLARGIDTCAHTACLDAGGRTVAVLGNGLSSVYPPENEALAQRIIESGGCLLSEMRLEDAPSRWSFPARNRIIAGLSEGVLVIEGKITSGSLITASHALDGGKEVFAVPGGIYSSLSAGPNRLIQDGAHCALTPRDVLETMHWAETAKEKRVPGKLPDMDENELKIYNCVKNEAKSFDELLEDTGFTVSELNCHLTMLLLRSIIIKLPGNMYRAS